MPKTSLRKHYIKLRNNIPAQEAKIAATNAADNFIKHIKLQKVKTIAFYHPIRGEIDPLPLLEKILSSTHTNFLTHVALWLKGKKLLAPLPALMPIGKKNIIFSLPTVLSRDSHLLFHSWHPGDKLKKNALYPQLLESKIQKEHIIPDIILVPLVAFDENCHRLGYGAGFYDRTIRKIREEGEKTKHPLVIGYAYECQKSPSVLPTLKHDMPLDYIITDKAVYCRTIQ